MNSSFAGVIASEAINLFTNRQNVRVCFASESGWSKPFLSIIKNAKPSTPEFRNIVVEAILNNFNSSATGIQYSFIGVCDKTSENVDAVVVYQESGGGQTFYDSRELWGLPYRDRRPYIVMGPGSESEGSKASNDYIYSTAIHEFAHLSGIGHEHLRGEALEDSNCNFIEHDMLRRLKIFGHLGSLKQSTKNYTLTGSYDPYSITNYCYTAFLEATSPGTRPELSAGDRSTLLNISF